MEITKTQFILLAAVLVTIAILYKLGGAQPVSFAPPAVYGVK